MNFEEQTQTKVCVCMEKYEVVNEEIGIGRDAVVRLMRCKETKDLVAVKYIPREDRVRCYLCIHLYFVFPMIWRWQRKIINPRSPMFFGFLCNIYWFSLEFYWSFLVNFLIFNHFFFIHNTQIPKPYLEDRIQYHLDQ